MEDNKCPTKLESENLFTNLASKLSETQKIFWGASSSLRDSRSSSEAVRPCGAHSSPLRDSRWPQSGHSDLLLRGKSRSRQKEREKRGERRGGVVSAAAVLPPPLRAGSIYRFMYVEEGEEEETGIRAFGGLSDVAAVSICKYLPSQLPLPTPP